MSANKPILSIVLPSIREYNWNKVINSIEKNCSYSWELIISGPLETGFDYIPEYFDKNVKFVRDFGSPTRASQIAATLAEGKFITWTADDGIFVNNGLTKAIDLLEQKLVNGIPSPIVVAKYSEGDGIVHNDDYYRLANAYPSLSCVDRRWWIFNVAFMLTDDFFDLGGWDCRYEACPLAHADLALRCQAAGLPVYLLDSNEHVLECTHMPGTSGDHAPIHYGQTEHDQPAYIEKFKDGNFDVRIPLDNWRLSPTIWERRFTNV